MRKFLLAALICLALAGPAEAGLLNEYDSFKEFVNNLKIKHGMFYDANASNWQHVISGSVYDFHRKDIPVVSIDAGYMVQDIGLVTASLNIRGLEAYGITIPIGDLHPSIGFGVGYDFRHHEPVFGPALFGFTWGF